MAHINKEDTLKNKQRRQFITGMSVAVVASTVVTSVSSNEPAHGVKVDSEPSSSSGYRETQHIRDYYDSL